MLRSQFRSAPRVGVGRPALVLVPLLALLLSACGVVAGFIPPQDIGDPMGIDGTEVVGTMSRGGLSFAEVSHLDSTSTFTFGDVFDPSDLPGGFSIASVIVDAGLAATVRVIPAPGQVVSGLPESLEVTAGSLRLTLEDDDHGPVTFNAEGRFTGLTFDRGTCDTDGCEYVVGDPEAVMGVLTVRARGDAADTLVDIVTIGDRETENRGELRVGIEVDSDPSLEGAQLRFTLTSEGTKIKLGG